MRIRLSIAIAGLVLSLLSIESATGATGSGAASSPGPSQHPDQDSHAPLLADGFLDSWRLTGRSVTVGGLGSSVGAGATLSDPGRDAPVAYFASSLEHRVDPSNSIHWSVVNGSVNGSTIHDGLARDWPLLATHHPDVVVLAYGMNDGAPAQFESGETYNGAMHDLGALIDEIRSSGAIPVVLTSPSPHTGRFNWYSADGQAALQRPPVDTTRSVRRVRVPGVGWADESTRHAAVDAGMRGVAAAKDVDLVDVEGPWLAAVASHGQDKLFNPSEFVHPNLLGHRLSYHHAIAAWFASEWNQHGAVFVEPRFS